MKLQHHFLIAMPSIQDPIFRKTVVYICEHGNGGSMGIIVNKPIADFTLNNILQRSGIFSIKNDSKKGLNNPILIGGPLSEDRGFVLHTPCSGFSSSITISSQTMITTSKDVLETIGTEKQPNDILIALGYSGWERGQLEYELINNDWLIVPANRKILFETPIHARWREASKTIGLDIYNISNQIGHA